MAQYIETKNHGTNLIDLNHLTGIIRDFRPIELHLKEDGAKDGTPSFAMIMDNCEIPHLFAAGQFSLSTITEAFKELGYKLEKI